METFKTFYIRECPDYIISSSIPGKRITYNNNKESYACVVCHSSTPMVMWTPDHLWKIDDVESGMHAEVRYAAEFETPDADKIKSNSTFEDMRPYLTRNKFTDFRIWTENRIVSFWEGCPCEQRSTVIELVKTLKLRPENCVFETEYATYYPNQQEQNASCLTYEEFINCADQKFNLENDPAGAESKRASRFANRQALAQTKMGIVKKGNDEKYQEVPGFIKTKQSSIYKRSGD